MKAKLKSGGECLFLEGNDWSDLEKFFIINFKNKGTYLGFNQFKNHLIVKTTEGEVDLVFTGETPKVTFDHYEKDQLVLNV